MKRNLLFVIISSSFILQTWAMEENLCTPKKSQLSVDLTQMQRTLTPRIQQEMQENSSLENKILTPRSHLMYNDNNQRACQQIEAARQKCEKLSQVYKKYKSTRDNTELSSNQKKELLDCIKNLSKELGTAQSKLDQLEYPFKLKDALQIYKEQYAPTAKHELIQQTFPAIFDQTVSSQRTEDSKDKATLLLQVGMVKNDLTLVKKALKKGAWPNAKRMPLKELCGSPEYIPGDPGQSNLEEWATNEYFKGEYVVGLCAILCNAHSYKAKESEQYSDDLSKINTLVWNAYQHYQTTPNRQFKLKSKKNSRPK